MTQETKFTPGPWKTIALGGASTVVADTMPKRNDARCHFAYGYEVDGKYCVGYPVLGGDGGEQGLLTPRLDYIHFSHADAHLISAAPDMYEALEATLSDFGRWADIRGGNGTYQSAIDRIMSVLAKARGEQ